MAYRFKRYCKQSDFDLNFYKRGGKAPAPVQLPEEWIAVSFWGHARL